jgi:hypothetical protein
MMLRSHITSEQGIYSHELGSSQLAVLTWLATSCMKQSIPVFYSIFGFLFNVFEECLKIGGRKVY